MTSFGVKHCGSYVASLSFQHSSYDPFVSGHRRTRNAWDDGESSPDEAVPWPGPNDVVASASAAAARGVAAPQPKRLSEKPTPYAWPAMGRA